MSIRWGILSTARINDALLGSGAGNFVAVASRDAERARAYADERGIPHAHGSYEELLAASEIDAVYISLPNELHVPWSIRALRAGKHVLCEKPLSRRAAEVGEAFDVAKEEGLVLAEAFMWRHHPQVSAAVGLLREGAVGRLRLLRASFSFLLDREGDVRFDAGLSGGGLMDVGCYCVSGVRTLAGAEPLSVQAMQVTSGTEGGVDVMLTGLLRFPGDVLATIDCGLAMPDRPILEAVGEEGRLVLTDPWHGAAPSLALHRPGGAVEQVHVGQEQSYALEIRDFEAAIRGEHAPLLGRDDAVAQARVIESLYRSAHTGAAVDVPQP